MKSHSICLIKAEMTNYKIVNEMQKELYSILKRFNKQYSKCNIVKRKFDEAVESFWGKGAKQFTDIRMIQCNDDIIGYVRLERDQELLIIKELYISSESRSNGIGEKVLNTITTDYASSLNAQFVRLHVDEKNIKAKKFYERNGFDIAIHLYEEKVYAMEKKVRKQYNNSFDPFNDFICAV